MSALCQLDASTTPPGQGSDASLANAAMARRVWTNAGRCVAHPNSMPFMVTSDTLAVPATAHFQDPGPVNGHASIDHHPCPR